MPIDDFTGDKPDAAANAATTPGKYLKLVVPDFSDTASNTNPAHMAPTPLTSYLRLGAVEDVTKAGKTAISGGLGLITDMSGYPLVYGNDDPEGNPQYNAPFNPAYDPYADFGNTNLPADGKTPLPPATTPTEEIPTAANPSPPPQGAPAYTASNGPDATGEDLASLIQGFADDTRNRGRLRMTLRGMVDVLGAVVPATPGGNPRDQMATAQGPLYGYPWVTPVTGAKAPGQLDAGNTSTSTDPQYTASSKPVFFPDDYRTLESSQLHTKGGWRDHTDGNRITTTRGDKIEVIRGNYKLIVLGRQDQTKPNKYAAVDMSGGFATTEPAGDASTDYSPGSTAYSNLFEWRQCTTPATFGYEAGLYQTWLSTQGVGTVSTHDADAAQATLDQALVAAQALADPRGVLQSTIAAAQQMVLTADSPARQLIAATALAAAKKALLTAEQAVDPDLLQGSAMNATAALVPPGVTVTDAYAAAVKQDSTYAANDPTNGVWFSKAGTTVGDVTAAINAATGLSTTATNTKTWATAVQAWAAWTSNPPDIYADPNAIANPASATNTLAADTATSAYDATVLANAQAASAQASAAATAAYNAALAAGADPTKLTTATQAAAQAATDAATAAADEQAAAGMPGVNGGLLAAAMDAQAALAVAQQAVISAQKALTTAQQALATATAPGGPGDPMGTLAAAVASAQTALTNAQTALTNAQTAATTALTNAEAGLNATTVAAIQKAAQDANTAATDAVTSAAATKAAGPSSNANLAAAVSAAAKAAATAATAAAAVQALEAQAIAAAAKVKGDAPAATIVLATAAKNALAAWTGTINGQPVPATNAVMCAARLSQLALNAPPDNLNKTDRAAYEWGKAATAEAQLQASAMALGTIFMSPLETLQIWEDVDPDPLPFPHYADGDYRTVSTAKKGGGPKVQLKYQAGGRNNDYAQKPVDGDGFVRGATFATPISMGVSINETWSYQIYNYTGIGYYPATAPQPWPPAPPQGKTQPLGAGVDPTQMAGVALPAKPPDRDPATLEPWPSPVPEWVIYPVAKSVTKTHVLQQSTETFVNQTVTILAGPRSHPSVKNHLQPERTTPSDVMSYVDTSGNVKTSYADQTGARHPLATQAVYDRNLLTDPNTQFSATQFPSGLVDSATAATWPNNNNVPPTPPTTPAKVAAAKAAAKAQLTAWILGGNPLQVGSYNMIPHTWSETHVSHQATILRADTTLSDTLVRSQNTMVNADDTTTHTTVTGLQHNILHAGAITTENTVDGQQSTTLNAGSTFSQITAGTTSTINNVGAASTITNAFATSAITNTLASFSMQNTAMVALALKGALVDLSITAALKHIGMNIGICLDITVGPHFTMKLAHAKLNATDLNVSELTAANIATLHTWF